MNSYAFLAGLSRRKDVIFLYPGNKIILICEFKVIENLKQAIF